MCITQGVTEEIRIIYVLPFTILYLSHALINNNNNK